MQSKHAIDKLNYAESEKRYQKYYGFGSKDMKCLP